MKSPYDFTGRLECMDVKQKGEKSWASYKKKIKKKMKVILLLSFLGLEQF